MGKLSVDYHLIANQVDLFTKKPNKRKDNDRDNKTRETAIAALFSSDEEIQRIFIDHKKNKLIWKQIKKEFSEKILNHFFPKGNSNVRKCSIVMEYKAGMSNNYDFLASIYEQGVKKYLDIKLEFKRGNSIFDQPQFWSPYAGDGYIITKSTTAYVDFFYSTYSERLSTFTSEAIPVRDRYMSMIFNPKYDQHPFFMDLYKKSKRSSTINKKLHELKDESIDIYLDQIRQAPRSIDLISLETALEKQLDKVFLSWSSEKMELGVEVLSQDDLKLSNRVGFKRGRKGLFNTVIFSTLSGKSISALLRWRNHPCVLVPAWQVKLSPKNLLEKDIVIVDYARI